jgi:hypothetical protein
MAGPSVTGMYTILMDETRATEAKVGFYGLDLYSLYTSIDAVACVLG